MAIVAYDSHKIIIIYNVKCAQTTLYSVFGKPWAPEPSDYFKNSWGVSDSSDISKFKEKMKARNYYVVDFVRNPYSRMISMWRYSYQTTPETPEFEEWLETCYKDWKEKKPPHYSTPLSLSFFINDINLVNFIGKQETLEKDVKFIADKFGIEFKPLPFENVSEKRKIDFTPESKKMVLEMYREDFDMFGYEK